MFGIAISSRIYNTIGSNNLPMPDYSTIDFNDYEIPNGALSELSRGCTAKCTFCEETHFWKYRQRQAVDALTEIEWLYYNKYIIYSELLRFTKILLESKLDTLQAIMVSNLSDNIVFVLKRNNINITLNKAMDYFMSIEEYEKCAEIRDLNILIQNLENETANIKISKSNKRGLESNR
jgi:radical SAM superfamily enzyme YgiQ (UPF0313 family)